VRSAVDRPGVLTKVPEIQLLQDSQRAAFALVLKRPLEHERHVRSLVAWPGPPTNWPAKQLVHGSHTVAGLLS